jgi:hypothetical protein
LCCVSSKLKVGFGFNHGGFSGITNTIQPFGLRVNTHFENSDIHLDDIAPIVIPENPPWLNPKPTFNFELTQKRIGTDHEFTLFRRGNELQGKKYCISFCTEKACLSSFKCYSVRIVGFL